MQQQEIECLPAAGKSGLLHTANEVAYVPSHGYCCRLQVAGDDPDVAARLLATASADNIPAEGVLRMPFNAGRLEGTGRGDAGCPSGLDRGSPQSCDIFQ
jgi:hypothetical protein